MRARPFVALFLAVLASLPTYAQGQPTIAPTVIPVSGQLLLPTGEPRAGTVVLTLGVYAEREGSTPIWFEEQTVTLDASGRYFTQFGAMREGGLPAEIFADGGARWLGVAVDHGAEQPRIMLLSVPYAAKAAVADTLSGLTSTDFVLRENLAEAVKTAVEASVPAAPLDSPAIVSGAGSTERIPKFLNGSTIIDSEIREVEGAVKLGITRNATLEVVNHVGATVGDGNYWIRTNGGAGNTGTVQQIGMGYPGYRLPVTFGARTVLQSGSTNAAFFIATRGGDSGTLAPVERFTVTPAGDVGIGATAPLARLEVFNDESAYAGDRKYWIRLTGGGGNTGKLQQIGMGYAAGSALSPITLGARTDSASQFTNAAFFVATRSGTAGDGAPMERFTILPSGNVGIGFTAPSAKLHIQHDEAAVQGDSKYWMRLTGGAGHTGEIQQIGLGYVSPGGGLSPVSIGIRTEDASNGTTATFFVATRSSSSPGSAPVERFTVSSAGNVSVTGDLVVDGNVAAKYQDVAEWVDAATELEPGTVVVIDTTTTNRVQRSTRAYDARVAGAVSPQPGVVLGEPGPNRELIAQSGRVRVKVDASYGAIRPGDLLVTSATPGYAMRSRAVNVGGMVVHRPGTIIGKALEALPKGKGEILVLLTLQ